MRSKKPTRKKLVEKAAKIFSLYIRQRNAKNDGLVECFTCGKKDHWKNLQCGHFQSRKHYGTRWDETNCQVQCSACNVFRYGEQYKFGVRLDKDYGQGTAEDLHAKAIQITKYSNNDLQGLITKYTALVKKKMK